MTLACAAMHRGSMREEDIVHCDIKPGNGKSVVVGVVREHAERGE